ncbi:TRAP transporter small permease [Bacillus dakarensis]|uniref:TRAP transporter small permease n=1 Tax=Robertmurraya dakarensis TaxID=1926278 RepID=UPI000981A4C2|nr:TRAP transporter small permease [Bacillus dakarensis]
MEKLDNILVKFLYWICALLMFLMVTIITAQVISRYVFGNPFTWSEELGRYTFVWMSFLGMAVGMKYGSHIALDILEKKLKGVSQKTIILFNNLLLSVFGFLLTYSGFQLVQLGARQTSPSLGIPMQYVYMVIPISGIILLYFVISNTIQSNKRKEEAV